MAHSINSSDEAQTILSSDRAFSVRSSEKPLTVQSFFCSPDQFAYFNEHAIRCSGHRYPRDGLAR